MPALPAEIAKRLVAEFGINASEAAMLSEDEALLSYFNAALPSVNHNKSLVNWLTGAIRALLNEQGISIADFKLAPAQLAGTINLVDDKKITQQIALQQLLPELISKPDAVPAELAAILNLLIADNGDELSGFVEEVLSKYQPQVAAYKKGKKGVLGLFVGEVMKLAKGKADAQKINELLQEKLK
ncbi:Aspartyl/glutamyl-tRNA(Asn/Gln) amidotransferase subunit B [compost metagenome]